MAKSKGWELDSIKVTGSKAFCDEVARQIAEIKAKEKAEQERKLKELEKENERLKAELANNRTETALETQNEPKPSQDITQSEKTQENVKKPTELEIIESILKKETFSNEDCEKAIKIAKENDFKQIADLEKDFERYKKYHQEQGKLSFNMPKPKYELEEIQKWLKQKESEKLQNIQLKHQEQNKTTIAQKVNLNTKSQSQEKGRKF